MAIEDQAQTTILAIGVDTGNSVQEFQKVSAAADKMGGVISNAADVAAAALARQGQAQEQAAKQSKRSTDAAVRTLQTEIAARAAGGRATARYYELIYANSSKVDQQAIAPLIAKYKELEAQQVAAAAASKKRAEAEKKAAQDAAAAVQAQIEAQKAATAAAAARAANAQPQRGAGIPGGSVSGLPDISEGTRQLEKMGMTAKATSAALRQVPAQFTDIVVSLQGGQAPLTVFLQQGGQLKDVFGGAGAAAQALGSYLVGLVNPISLAVAAVATIGLAAYNSREDLKALNAVLITTGNRAGTTSAELANIAESISKQGFSFSQGAAALVEFAKAGVNAGDKLGELTKIALDLEKFGGQAVRKTAADFAALGKDPVAASLELNKELGYLSRTTLEYIDRLVKQGDSVKAAAVAQEAYADATRRSAAALEANLGPIDIALNYYTVKGKAMWDALRGLVGPDTGNEQFAKLQQQLAGVRAQLADTKPTLPGQESSAQKELLAQEKILLNQINYYTRLNEASKLAGEQEGKRTRQTQLAGEWLAKYASASEKQAATEKRIRSEGIELGKTELEIQKAIALSRGKQSATGSKLDTTEAQKGIKLYNDLISKSEGFTADYAEQVQKLAAAYAAGDLKATELSAAVDILNSKQPGAVAQAKAVDDARKASEATLRSYNKELENSADSVAKSLQKYQDERAALELSRDNHISLEEAVNDLTIARLEEQLVKEKIANNPVGEAAITREIKDRRELAKEIRSKDVREANDKAAKSAADSWKKAADQIGDSITDALFRGFESGKGFIDNLIATAENAFKTMVLRPAIEATVRGVFTGGGGGDSTNPFSGIASLSKSFESASLAFTDFKLFATNSAYDVGGALTNAGFDKAGSLVTENASQIGSLANTVGQTLSYLESASNFKDGSYGASIGQAAGTAFFGPIGGMIGKELGGFVDRLFAGGSYVQSLGESVATVTAAKLVNLGGSGGNNDVSIGGGLNIRQTLQSDTFVSGLASAFVTAAGKLGIATQGATFGAGFNDSDGGKFAVEATVGGQKFDPGQVKFTDENLQLQASRAVFFALQSSELPAYLSKVFDDVNVSAASQVDIDTALGYAASLKEIRDSLTETRTPLQILQASVDSAFTTLGTSAASFKTDFVAAIDSGISPEKLAEYVKLGQNLSTLDASTGKAANTIDAAAESLKAFESAMQGLKTTGFDLETELLQLQGVDTSGRTRTNDLANLTKGVTDQEQINTTTAQYDYNESLKLSIKTLTAIKEATLSATESQRGYVAQFTKPIDKATASELLGTSVVESLLGKSGDDIREMARVYVASLDVNTEAGREAISAFDKLTPAISLFADAADSAAQTLANAISSAQSSQASAVQRYTAPLNDATAGALIGPNAVASIAGKSSAEIREMARLYVASLDSQTEAGREAIAQFNDMIPAVDYFANAADEAARTVTRDAETTKVASDKMRDAIKSIADSLLSEAARIRNDLQLASNQSYATAQGKFTITAAQARAGDTEAAKLLPELARSLTDLASTNAASADELRNVRASTASTLEDVAKRLGYQPTQVSGTMSAYQPPQVVSPVLTQPQFINTMTSGQAQSDTSVSSSELQQLRAIVAALKLDTEKLVVSNDKIRLVLQLVTQNGEAMKTVPA